MDPQYGWLRDPSVTPMFSRLSQWLTHHHLWPFVLISTFYNAPDSPLRQQLPWWHGFQSDPDTMILPDFLAAGCPIFPRSTYGLPPALWHHLQQHAITHVLLTGVETDASILHAAMEGVDRHLIIGLARHFVASSYGPTGQHTGCAVAGKVLGRDHLFSPDQALNWLNGTS
ncbi:MAG: isochorismatase family protein [Firmicutes bacterium]|nr:isochorismatase family protein [Bacillota bacterium]